MEVALQRYVILLNQRVSMRSVIQGLAFMAASMIAIFAAVSYATENASNHVTDLILSNIGPFDVGLWFVYGTFVQFGVFAGLILWWPNRLPFALKAIALFLLVRTVFVSLTHIAPSPIDPHTPAPFFNSIFHGGDLFSRATPGCRFLPH